MTPIQNAKTFDELRSTYRYLAMAYHPDRGGDIQMMQKLNQEYALRKRILENKQRGFHEIQIGETIYVNGTESVVILVTKTKFVARAKRKSKQAWFDRNTGIGIDFPYYRASFNPIEFSSNSSN